MDDIRNRILDKAKERLDRFGFKKTTMDEISQDCKVSKKTLYAHFKDKEDLFTCVLIRESRKSQEIIFARMGTVDDPLQRLAQLMRIGIAYFNEDNFLTRLLKDDAAIFSELSVKYHRIVDEDIVAMLVDIIREAKNQGQIRDIDEQVVAYAGLKLVHAFSYMRTMQFDKAKSDQGYYTEALIDFVTQAIVTR